MIEQSKHLTAELSNDKQQKDLTQKREKSWKDYIGVCIFQLLIVIGWGVFKSGHDGLILQALEHAYIGALVIPVFAGLWQAHNWTASCLMFVVGAELLVLSFFAPGWYQLKNTVSSEAMTATNVSVESHLLDNRYRVVANNTIFLLEKDLVTIGQEFTVETRASDDGRVKRKYLCAKERCTAFYIR